MARPLWLALIFLIGICALAALKVGIARPAKQQAALADKVIGISGNALAKTDKLDVEVIPDKKVIRSIAIAQPEAAQKQMTKIISHWQDGYAKAKLRQRPHHRHVSRKPRRLS